MICFFKKEYDRGDCVKLSNNFQSCMVERKKKFLIIFFINSTPIEKAYFYVILSRHCTIEKNSIKKISKLSRNIIMITVFVYNSLHKDLIILSES
jgi:hypothetical protein